MSLGIYLTLVGFVALQRLVELGRSRRNESQLRLDGAVEFGHAHYPVMKGLHSLWLVACIFEGSLRSSLGMQPTPGSTVVWLAGSMMVLGQLLRYIAIGHLGCRWTTRVLVLPARPLVQHGVYGWLPHPNYLGVILEIAALPLLFHCYGTAVIFSLANGCLLWVRVAAESRALKWSQVHLPRS